MNIEEWKSKTDEERSQVISSLDSFNPYSDEAYELIRELGWELANGIVGEIKDVGVVNKHGQLIIHLCSDAKVSAPQKYMGFSVLVSSSSSWFMH